MTKKVIGILPNDQVMVAHVDDSLNRVSFTGLEGSQIKELSLPIQEYVLKGERHLVCLYDPDIQKSEIEKAISEN